MCCKKPKSLLGNKKPSHLTGLANAALLWTSDYATKSELQEVTKLVLDNIVRRYCGAGDQYFSKYLTCAMEFNYYIMFINILISHQF